MSDKIEFLLDLDAKDFAHKVENAVDKVVHLQETLGKVATVTGVLGAAFLTVKTAISLVAEGEELKALEDRFNFLADGAGIAGEQVLNSMMDMSDGLISGSAMMKLASKGIVELGENAARMPEIMQLARRASVVMGEDTAATFERLTQAVATGQTKQLKAMGIIIDSEQVYRKYAESLGLASNALSEADKRQAILNETLKIGKEKLEGVDTEANKTANGWTKFKNAMGDVIEALALMFSKVLGPAVHAVLDSLVQFAEKTKKITEAAFGEGSVKARAQLELLEGRVQSLTKSVEEYDKKGQAFIEGTLRFAGDARFVDQVRERIAKMKAEVASLQAQLKQGETDRKPGGSETGGEAGDQAQKLANESRFQKDILALRNELVLAQKRAGETSLEVETRFAEQKLLLEAQLAQRITEIRSRSDLNPEQKNREIELATIVGHEKIKALETQFGLERFAAQKLETDNKVATARSLDEQFAVIDQNTAMRKEFIEQELATRLQMIRDNSQMSEMQKIEQGILATEAAKAKEVAIVQEGEKRKSEALENHAKHATSVAGAISGAFEVGAKKAAIAQADFGAMGQRVYNSFAQNATTALQQVGSGQKSAGEAAKGFIFNLIADEAMARGSLLLLQGLWPPNPVALAAGGALVALGAFLKSQAGGGGGGSAPSAPTGAGAVSGATGFQPDTARPLPVENRTQKAVSLTVQGNYFETDQTKQRIVEMIREASDATDFKITQGGE